MCYGKMSSFFPDALRFRIDLSGSDERSTIKESKMLSSHCISRSLTPQFSLLDIFCFSKMTFYRQRVSTRFSLRAGEHLKLN